MSEQGRHLTRESFIEYLNADYPVDLPIDGEPRVLIFVDTDNRRIGLRVSAGAGEKARPTGLEHVKILAVHHQGQRMIEVEIDEPRLFVDAYPILRGVADRIQLDRMSVARALSETLRRLGHLIKAEQSLTREVETGLIGELTLLAGLVTVMPPELALTAWRGGSEEHDFGLPSVDVEVKTTTSESRSHRISSATQLQATGERALWLLSMQLTAAGTDGTTVAALIERVRALFTTPLLRDEFDSRVQAAGWAERYANSSLQRWRFRSEPAIYHVAGNFPRLTAEQLAFAGTDLNVITDIRYRIDLSGRTGDEAPEPLRAAVQAGRQELP
ncbi:PD-(D/E)XK motif protein [Actinoplanes sp. LDG1-06]|uniref:PD-(D/E)XK motif protein n=1 Tax=Paractinoplanes ovalisporus TaxID=2810368 RepID=A0ABS2AB75_9ACTN|nr:PD-(D/E)XK motif protein [Actinoplanes ovalisporus]MBM2617043.1 PD-(D/E)XK motif protein [Actinoplanes ovalisporus]